MNVALLHYDVSARELPDLAVVQFEDERTFDDNAVVDCRRSVHTWSLRVEAFIKPEQVTLLLCMSFIGIEIRGLEDCVRREAHRQAFSFSGLRQQ